MPTIQTELQRIDTPIGTLEFTHGFANGYPTEASVEKLYDERDFQRACQAYLWSLPAVSFTAWQRGITKELGARNGQIVAILSYEARRGILTANATTPYYLGFADLSSEPFMLEIPERGVEGGISDSWQNAMGETNVRGKYLVLAPDQKVPGNVDGYIVHSPTNNMFLGIRLTDTDPESAKQVLAQLKMYPYTQHDNPPKMEILDAGTKTWNGQPPRGMEYWERLDDVIQREPIEPRDAFFHAMLRPVGLEKGKPFKPDKRQSKILTDAAMVGEATAKANSADRRFAGVKYRTDGHWDFPLQLDADNPGAFWNLLDERASWFYEAVGAGPSMAPKRPGGPSSAYLSAYKDKTGEWLDGGMSYRLRVPPNPPIKLFWSVTVYDVDTRALILNEQKIADRSSRMDLLRNTDGSVDIYCGPNAPVGFEKNWIPTVPGKNWFAYFRFYQPTEGYFDRSWQLPDFEQVSR